MSILGASCPIVAGLTKSASQSSASDRRNQDAVGVDGQNDMEMSCFGTGMVQDQVIAGQPFRRAAYERLRVNVIRMASREAELESLADSIVEPGERHACCAGLS